MAIMSFPMPISLHELRFGASSRGALKLSRRVWSLDRTPPSIGAALLEGGAHLELRSSEPGRYRVRVFHRPLPHSRDGRRFVPGSVEPQPSDASAYRSRVPLATGDRAIRHRPALV